MRKGHPTFTCLNRGQNYGYEVFGHVHVRRLQEAVAYTHTNHFDVWLSTPVPDDRPAWKRPRDRPRQTWIRQLEIDVGLVADARDMASDRDVWRAQRPVAGQAVQ